jgi:hypothetical protein
LAEALIGEKLCVTCYVWEDLEEIGGELILCGSWYLLIMVKELVSTLNA